MEKIKGVLLDIDGTLVESNDAHARAWHEALAEHGIPAALDHLRRLIGMGGDKLLPAVADLRADSDLGKRISARRGAIFESRYLSTLKPTRGARDLLRHLREEGLKLAVASSSKAKDLDRLLEICGADKLVEARTSADDAANSKPDADIVIAALEQVGLPAEQVVMLGDTPYDIEAAGRAGVAVISLRCGGWDDGGLAGALAVYQDPADLLGRYYTSPLATR